MDMRVTPQTILARALAATALQTSQFGKLQEQASSGKKVLVPSDDPAHLGALLNGKTQDQRLETYLSNIAGGRSALDLSVSTLTEASNIFQQARSLALEGASSSNDAAARNALAQQVDELINRLGEIVNTQSNGRYIFAGTATQTPPFVIAKNADGSISGATYQGADQRDAVLISGQQTIATLYSGAEIFQSHDRGITTYLGTTGAAAGSGTDSATGRGTLLVQHTSTTFAAGSGVQAGTSSAAGDTIIGPAGAYQLTINDTSGTGASGTISMNGGPPVAFSNTDTDLVVTGPKGEIVHLDTTAITPGFSGTIALTANGTLSTDGGASSVPITFAANQQVTNSVDGGVTNVNSVNIRTTGTEALDYTGSADAFQALIELRDDLRNKRGLTEPEQIAALSAQVSELDRVRTNVLTTVGEQSSSLENLDNLESHLQDLQLTTKKLISSLEDVDISQVVIDLQNQQNLLQATLGSTARLMSVSLLDFLH
ncbi:MAG: flagellar hook-associated protein FlgL [Gemmataceae bacterium]